jgi:putative hemolysin
VRDRTGIQLPDGEFDTLGGYVQDTLGRVPTVGDSVPLQDRRLVVEEMDGRRVATVRLEHSGEPDQAPARPTTAQLCGR